MAIADARALGLVKSAGDNEVHGVPGRELADSGRFIDSFSS